MCDLTVSIVTYNNSISELTNTMDSVLSTELDIRIYIIDNSPSDKLKTIFTDSSVKYIHNKKNIGFGAAHNLILNSIDDKSKYHLVLNPDIYFEKGTLEKILFFMEKNSEIGLLMPKVCNPDGSVRKIRRLLPSPSIFFGKILSNTKYFHKKESIYRTEFISYDEMMSAPFLSGCFMFFRTKELKKTGGFDERFFMYFEDVDLSRRFYTQSKSIYYPEASIVHLAHRESSKHVKLFLIHLQSAIKYFNKWGWFFDKERQHINRNIISGKMHLTKFEK